MNIIVIIHGAERVFRIPELYSMLKHWPYLHAVTQHYMWNLFVDYLFVHLVL